MGTLNEGTIDRILRFSLGAFLLATFFVGPRTYWGLLGLIPLLTAASGVCPIYKLFGINTCKMKK